MARQVPYVGYLSLGNDPHLVANRVQLVRGPVLRPAQRLRELRRARNSAPGGWPTMASLRAFTIVHRATPDVTVPYVSGIVDLDGGGVVKANIVGIDPEPGSLSLGMKVRLTTFPIGTDSAGTQAVSFGYQPA